jgi:hypothetical protein
MKISDFTEWVTPLTDTLEKDGDPYLLVHFSKEDNAYTGLHDGLDKYDALIIMRQLATHFNMDAFDIKTLSLITEPPVDPAKN